MNKILENNEEKISELGDFIVIGLGRFGRAVATTLFARGKEVLGIDSDPDNVKAIENKISTVVLGDATNNDVLFSLGAQNFDCAIVCIGDDLESSILVTQICKELGVKYIIAKATNAQHAKILTSIGADLIVYPEEFVGVKLGNALSKAGINEIAELTDEFKIFEAPVPEAWVLKTIEEISVNKKHKISIVFIKRGSEVIYPMADTVLLAGDIVIAAGDISKISSIFAHSIDVDIRETLQKAFGKSYS
ncbi:MAG: TrkA family potassium uptake protein [Clostridiales bacterium]|nr:TrkA family potassium uptake protein [Clostridiales bacterium]